MPAWYESLDDTEIASCEFVNNGCTRHIFSIRMPYTLYLADIIYFSSGFLHNIKWNKSNHRMREIAKRLQIFCCCSLLSSSSSRYRPTIYMVELGELKTNPIIGLLLEFSFSSNIYDAFLHTISWWFNGVVLANSLIGSHTLIHTHTNQIKQKTCARVVFATISLAKSTLYIYNNKRPMWKLG